MSSDELDLDQIVDEFEAEWRAGRRPDLAARVALAHSAESKQRLLEHLLPIELEYRLGLGEEPQAAEYQAFFVAGPSPWLHACIAEAVREWRARRRQAANVATTTPVNESGKSRLIGPYKLLQQLGEGGMGTVWMAEQSHPVRRRVALKLIKSGSYNQQVVARFESERQALAMMDHQNIAKVLDAGSTETGQPYFVMELVQGISLTHYCDQNRLSLQERLELLIPVCNAVQHAHQKGVIHRDLKPSNILVCLYDGKPVPKVIDFGLAKALQHQLQLTDKTIFTEFGQVVGTLQYMSPEQAEMNQLDVDTRTDVYSLGVILYELLTGSTPIAADSIRKEAILNVLEIIRQEDPPRPSVRLSSSNQAAINGISQQRRIDPVRLKTILRAELDWIAMKALEKDRTRRYPTANALGVELQRYLTGEPIIARPPSAAYRVQKFIRRNRGLVSSLAAIFSILILGVVGTSWFGYSAEQSRQNADLQKSIALAKTIDSKKNELKAQREAEKSQQAEQKAEKARQDAIKSLARSNFALTIARASEGRMREAYAFLAAIPTGLRDLEWYLAFNTLDRSDFTMHSPACETVTYSPSGRHIASGGKDGIVTIWDAQRGVPILTWTAHMFQVTDLDYSPTGDELASASSDGSVKIWNATTGAEIRTILDRTTVAETTNAPSFNGEEEIGKIPDELSSVQSVKYHPSGKSLATCATNGEVKLWHAATGEVLKSFSGHETSACYLSETRDLAFCPGRNWLASAGADALRIWDLETGGQLGALQPQACDDNGVNGAISVAFSPLGFKVVAGTAFDSIRVWDLTSGVPVKLPGHQGATTAMAWSPDGDCFATSGDDGVIRIYDAHAYQETLALVGHSRPVNDLAFSPDGSRIASCSSDGTVKTWDLRTGSPHLRLYFGKEHYHAETDPKRTKLFAVGDEGLRLWDAKTLQEIPLPQELSSCLEAAISADGSKLYACGETGSVFDWTIGDPNPPASLAAVGSPECVSPDNQYLLIDTESEVQIWDVKSRRLLHSLSNEYGPESPDWKFFQFSQDGKSVLITHLPNPTKGPPTLVINEGYVPKPIDTSLTLERRDFADWDHPVRIDFKVPVPFHSDIRSFDPNRHWLTAFDFDSKTFQLIDVTTGKQIQQFWSDDSILSTAVNSTGARAISGGRDGSIAIWDIETGSELMRLRDHPKLFMIDVAITRDDAWIISLSSPKSLLDRGWINIVSASRESYRQVFMTGDESVASVFLSEDGRHVLAEGKKGSRFAWSVDTGESAPADPVWPTGEYPPRPNSNAKHSAFAQDNLITLVDNDFAARPTEQFYRLHKTKLDSYWHLDRAILSDQRIMHRGAKYFDGGADLTGPLSRDSSSYDDHFSRFFHRYWHWKSNPQSLDIWIAMQEAHESWVDSYHDHRQNGLPTVLDKENRKDEFEPWQVLPVEMATEVRRISLPNLTLRQELAANWNERIREKIKQPNPPAPVTDAEVWLMEEINKLFPSSQYLNSLGVAYYRKGRHAQAIEALARSASEFQRENALPTPHPQHLAFLTLAHAALKQNEQAERYRGQLQDAMKLESFQSDAECQLFAAEVEETFGKKKQSPSP